MTLPNDAITEVQAISDDFTTVELTALEFQARDAPESFLLVGVNTNNPDAKQAFENWRSRWEDELDCLGSDTLLDDLSNGENLPPFPSETEAETEIKLYEFE